MPIQSFILENTNIIRKAYCENVPKLMIIAGRNGVGKSTLLNGIRKYSGDKVKGTGKILYSGPHRTWRRRNIKRSWLSSVEREYSTILSADTIPSFEGIGIPDAQRRYNSTDEAPGFIKYILGQIEARRKNAIISEIDSRELKYPGGYAPDVYKPLKDMLTVLLPHLQFIRVDQGSPNDVKFLFGVDGVTDLVDIDDLSSGEKEIIALFMPLLERQIGKIIRRMERGKEPDIDTMPDTVMVLDEPDLHIHPELLKRMLDYMRKRASEDDVQFIIATHSPTIINEATSEELFSLLPRNIEGVENQLQRVISNQDKLNLFKDVCGDVAILTMGKPIVFIEGITPDESRNSPSDQRILELLCSGAKDLIFIPMGGKDEVEKATVILNQIITEQLIGLPTSAIVDADLDIETASSGPVIRWEFCCIENILLNPESIYEILKPYREKTGVNSANDVQNALISIAKEFISDETSRRLRRIIPSFHLHFKGSNCEELLVERDKGIRELKNLFVSKDRVNQIINKTLKEVEEMISDKSFLQKFNGKLILGRFYQAMVASRDIGMNFTVFCYSVAKNMGEQGRTPKSVVDSMVSIKERVLALHPETIASQPQ